MTPLRFRAWDKKNARWVSGNLAIDCGGMLYWIFGDSVHLVEKDEFVVMQSTGLEDGNGKEIFEGDIVKPMYGQPGVVRWMEVVIEGVYSIWTWGYDEQEGWLTSRDEVIGNIYENPDLLNAA